MQKPFDPVSYLIERNSSSDRFLLGIVGCPGAGKSTFATWLAESLNRSVASGAAVALPLDGFHHFNAVLEERGLRSRKGAYDTYDVDGFTQALNGARSATCTFGWPSYSRELHEPVPNGLVIPCGAQFLVVEGNYLLLERAPWQPIRGLLDEIWFLESTAQERFERLWARHSKAGRSPEVIEKHMREVDLPNADLVYVTRRLAQRRLEVVQTSESVICFELS